MKRFLVLAVSLITLSCSIAWAASLQSGSPQIVAGERKIKIKGAKSIERDKSKPVRRAIEDWYAHNIAAFQAKDVAAIMSLRTDDFHTVTPDGKVNTRSDMEARTKLLLDRIDHFISQEFEIGVIDVHGDLAAADVTQKTVRMQRLPDGTLHKVEAAVVQRETWKRTTQGWKLYSVDNIRDGSVLVDDKPYPPAP
jgi:ketosteroid isomerase-like protein